MDDTIIMDAVIQKYFAGETSEQEEKYLLAWLEESEEHRKYFFELKSLWGARCVFEESTDLARFASFMRSTDHRIGKIAAGERSARRRKLVRWTLGAAAAVLLAVCAGTAWHFLSTPDIYRVYENTGDAVTTVTLDDGTHVWLNARTKLTLPEAFGPTQRNVQLAGAAFFEVARDEAAPFVVSTDKLRVRVLGTSFCMQAYEGSQQAEVVLEHGSVRLQTPAGVNLVTLHRPARPVRRCGRQPRHYAGQRFAPRADPVRPGDDVRRYAARDHLAHRDDLRRAAFGAGTLRRQTLYVQLPAIQFARRGAQYRLIPHGRALRGHLPQEISAAAAGFPGSAARGNGAGSRTGMPAGSHNKKRLWKEPLLSFHGPQAPRDQSVESQSSVAFCQSS